MSSRRLRHSRWRRLPKGLHRAGQKPPDSSSSASDLERLSLYLPANLLDQTQALAGAAGALDVPAYCEELLARALSNELARHRLASNDSTRAVLQSAEALAGEPDFLAGVSRYNATLPAAGLDLTPPEVHSSPTPAAERPPAPDPQISLEKQADRAPPPSESVAPFGGITNTLQDDSAAFLAYFFHGQAPPAELTRRILEELRALENCLADCPLIDRGLALALHRLALEGQILLSDPWNSLEGDPLTREALCLVQESVDRVLSGQDIRYFDPETTLSLQLEATADPELFFCPPPDYARRGAKQ